MRKLALTRDGRITYCTATEDNMGKGRCNHISHQGKQESAEEFVDRANKIIEIGKQDTNLGDPEYDNKMKMIKEGKGLKIFINDPDENIRMEVLKQGFFSEQVLQDKSWKVRATAVQKGMFLDRFVCDPDWRVRKEVASLGHGLDILSNDENPYVRDEVRKQGYTGDSQTSGDPEDSQTSGGRFKKLFKKLKK